MFKQISDLLRSHSAGQLQMELPGEYNSNLIAGKSCRRPWSLRKHQESRTLSAAGVCWPKDGMQWDWNAQRSLCFVGGSTLPESNLRSDGQKGLRGGTLTNWCLEDATRLKRTKFSAGP